MRICGDELMGDPIYNLILLSQSFSTLPLLDSKPMEGSHAIHFGNGLSYFYYVTSESLNSPPNESVQSTTGTGLHARCCTA